MRVGKIRVEHPRLEVLALGYESMPLRSFRFEPDDDGEPVQPALSNAAHLCPSCDTLVLAGAHSALTCFECKAPIADDEQACSQCGWTWK
jgi:hypothetical protein